MEHEHRMTVANGVRMHHVTAGSGPPLILLHGWPQTWYMWRHLFPPLAEHFSIAAPDLRGYGLTDKPASGYDKRTMAADIRALAHELGWSTVSIVGHDRGARVAHRYALDYPEEVERLAVLDIVPTRAMFRSTDPLIARGYWHWFFHLQPDLPEILVGPQIETYLRYFFERWTYRRAALEDAIPTYVEAFSRPGALRAGFSDYRATVPIDLTADDASAEAGDKLHMPLLVLWGESGLTNKLPVLDIWREYAASVEGEPVPDCGHFLPEEQPEIVARRLLRFLTDERTQTD